MIEIKEILSKFNSLLKKEDFNFVLIIDIIKNITNIEINKKDIFIKNNILYLKIKPIYKNEIFIKKNEILNILNKEINNRKIENIL